MIASCQGETSQEDADVLVVGAGIAGISAALEAADVGAKVLVIDSSSVPGGHAVKAGGFALVGTPLQERKGYTDTPEVAYRDLMAWGEDTDPEWARAYAEGSRTEVYDWLTSLGVKFAVVLETPDHSIPRFHFTRGPAVHAIVPMLRAAYGNENIRIVTNSSVEKLIRSGDAIAGVEIRNTRSGANRTLHAKSVVLATGGFQSNLTMVRANWRASAVREPDTLLIGSGQEATGSGIMLGEAVGAGLRRMDHQVTFVTGLRNPRHPALGLLTQNAAAIWVDADGRRFVNEATDSKTFEAAVMALPAQTHWLIFDAQGRRRLRIRGATWLNPDTINAEILENPEIGHKSDTIEALAAATGLPAENLGDTIERYNGFVAKNDDQDFDRFKPDSSGRGPLKIGEPPYYALQLFPMTRKSMGGLAIDMQGRVTDTGGRPIPGLFAAGELTGVAGINGSHGGSGTFLGPSVFTGRIAGRAAAQGLGNGSQVGAEDPLPGIAGTESDPGPMLGTEQLRGLLKRPRPGYWHFEQSHALILERAYNCNRCHSDDWPTMPAATDAQRIAQLESCTVCH